jgi:hypothetical protein
MNKIIAILFLCLIGSTIFAKDIELDSRAKKTIASSNRQVEIAKKNLVLIKKYERLIDSLNAPKESTKPISDYMTPTQQDEFGQYGAEYDYLSYLGIAESQYQSTLGFSSMVEKVADWHYKKSLEYIRTNKDFKKQDEFNAWLIKEAKDLTDVERGILNLLQGIAEYSGSEKL